MKLIYCPVCNDVRKINPRKVVDCECGKSWGVYEKDGLNATYGGKAIPLGFNNSSFLSAIDSQPLCGLGSHFEAFVIPIWCDTYERVT